MYVARPDTAAAILKDENTTHSLVVNLVFFHERISALLDLDPTVRVRRDLAATYASEPILPHDNARATSLGDDAILNHRVGSPTDINPRATIFGNNAIHHTTLRGVHDVNALPRAATDRTLYKRRHCVRANDANSRSMQ